MVYKPKSFALLDSGIWGRDTSNLLGFGALNQTTYTLQIPGFSWREKFTIHIYSLQIDTTNAEVEVEGSIDGSTWEVVQSYDPGSQQLSLTVAGVVQESAFPHMRFRMKNASQEAVFISRVVC